MSAAEHKLAALVALGPWDSDGYCVHCGNHRGKAGHGPSCPWADIVDDAMTQSNATLCAQDGRRLAGVQGYTYGNGVLLVQLAAHRPVLNGAVLELDLRVEVQAEIDADLDGLEAVTVLSQEEPVAYVHGEDCRARQQGRVLHACMLPARHDEAHRCACSHQWRG